MELNRTNKYVYHRFLRANDSQKKQMATILKQQLDNLMLLWNMMEKDLDVVALETEPVVTLEADGTVKKIEGGEN